MWYLTVEMERCILTENCGTDFMYVYWMLIRIVSFQLILSSRAFNYYVIIFGRQTSLPLPIPIVILSDFEGNSGLLNHCRFFSNFLCTPN